MTDVRIEQVYRRLLNADRTTREVELIWRTVTVDGRVIERMLIDVLTGELLDHVWLNENDRVCSYSAPKGCPRIRSARRA